MGLDPEAYRKWIKLTPYPVAGGRQAAMLARRRAMAEGGEEEEKEEKAMECTRGQQDTI